MLPGRGSLHGLTVMPLSANTGAPGCNTIPARDGYGPAPGNQELVLPCRP